jgi:feruloyl-CoA synthase
VLAGENAAFVGVLAWLNVAEAARLLGTKPESDGQVIIDKRLHRLLAQALAEYNDGSGSSARIERLLVMARPADLDAGEITDKGYVNQRKVLACRSALVAMLYAEHVPPGVVVAAKTA